MTNYTWIATYPDWVTDPHAWKPHHLPKADDTATISSGLALDWNSSTPANYTIGNFNPYQAPELVLFGTTAIRGTVLGYANIVNYGDGTFNFNVGTGAYWERSGGYLNFYNYGTVQGNITVFSTENSTFNLLGNGNFGGSISLPMGFHVTPEPISISNNLLPNTTVDDDGWGSGPGPGDPITFTGRADSSDVFTLGSNASLTLTKMQFLPSVVLDSDASTTTFAHTFSDNLQASLASGVLTIQDLGLGHTLSMHVTLPTSDYNPGGSWELFESQHSPGSNFHGLTLAYSNPPASGPEVIPL